MSDAQNRWMPPSPHRERILHEIAIGAAHIVERGHNVPPLLVFEDGGMIELPRVRLNETRRGLQLTASEEPLAAGQTRFGDVCGTVDEILGQVREGQALDPAEIAALLDDIRYMIGRMARRSQQYVAFFETIRATAEQALALPRPDHASAPRRLEGLRADLDAWSTAGGEDSQERVVASAEHARTLAQELEDYLAQCRQLAIDIHNTYAEIKGGRRWQEKPAAE